MNCTCRSRHLGDRCRSCQADADARQRMVDNALTAIARDWVTFPDHAWPVALYRYEVDDLHLLLEQETS